MSTHALLSTTALVLEVDTAEQWQVVTPYVLELWLADQLTRSARDFVSRVTRLDGRIRVSTEEAASGERTLTFGFTPTKKESSGSPSSETTGGSSS